MMAILDMQISWFFNFSQDNLSEHVEKQILEDLIDIDDWRASTSILNMQISKWRPSWICKFADHLNDFKLFKNVL